MNITAATAELVLNVPELLPTPTKIFGFSANDIFSTGSIKTVEVQMGMDGFMAAGWVPVERHLTIVLLASSLSNFFFDEIISAQNALRRPFAINGAITIESLGRAYNLINGYLTDYTPIAGAKRLLEPRSYGITFQDIQPIPV